MLNVMDDDDRRTGQNAKGPIIDPRGPPEAGDAQDGGAQRSEAAGSDLRGVYDPGMEKNLEFIRSMACEEAKQYMGEWLAVAGGGIVAHGKDPRRVHREGISAGKGGPLMYYIYARPEEVPFYYVPDD